MAGVMNNEAIEELIHTLKARFTKNSVVHQGMDWVKIEEKLRASPQKLRSLLEMEKTGGEPDVVFYEPQTDEFWFMDCSKESPTGRRSLCYDQDAFLSRKENRPNGSALALADSMGIEILCEEEYRLLQSLFPVDTKTSSWLKTPDSIRKQGGAIFGDYRYGNVFIYHNGAQSYYAARGFRGVVRV